MYEEYTDKQIVEMLKPKLEKLGWGAVVNNDLYPDTIKMIATIYRSGYIRGQLGRSFIIGEKANTNKRWVSVDGDNIKEGDSVRYINEEIQKNNPNYYPAKDVVGKVIKVCVDLTCKIQWPKGSTSGDDRWYAAWSNLEVLAEEPVKTEKWVPATKDNVKDRLEVLVCE